MIFKRTVILFAMTFALAGAAAQEPEESVYGRFEDDFRDISSDTTLFYMPLGDGSSIFTSLTRYGLSYVSYNARGIDERLSRASVAGIDFSPGMNRYPDYTLYTALSALTPESSRSYHDAPSGFYTPFAADVYGIRASAAPARHTVTYTYSDKRYRTGIRLRSAGAIGRGWYYAASLRGRWGEDAYVKGVFTDALMGSLAVEKIFPRGVSVSLFALLNTQERGMKGWTEAEAYRLTGNYQYNPYWGWCGGRVRNSRVNRDMIPLAVLSIDAPLSPNTLFHAAFGIRTGDRSRSALQWSDASNPAPDHYSNLPGHRAEPNVKRALEEAWRSGDPSFTQMDWNGIYEVNTFSGDGRCAYVLSRRLERMSNIQAVCSVARRNEYGFGYECGVNFRYERSRFRRIADDLLGGGYVLNADPFTGADGNVRNPDRMLGRGGAYDYDYDIVFRSAAVHGAGYYRKGRWSVAFGTEVSLQSLERRGRYEKEGLPGNLSFGSSGVCRFVPYSLHLNGRYNFTASHHIFAEAYLGEYAVGYEDIFLSPDYCNRRVERPSPVRIAGVRMDYGVRITRFARLEVAAYASATSGDCEIKRYYDDLYGVYAVLVMDNIRKMDWGVEAGISIDITEKLNLLVAMSIGSYTYSGDPGLTIVNERSLAVMMEGDRAHLDGFIHDDSPQTVIAAAVSYEFARQWNLSLQWMYADRRYVGVNPLRRTDRIASLAHSPEERAVWRRQERLPAASVVNINVSKGFSIFGMRVFASFTVNNLLGRSDIIYGGYEQMRLDKFTVRDRTIYRPFPSRYNYSYPRTFLASLTISF